MFDLNLKFETEAVLDEVANNLLKSTVSGVNTIERVEDTIFFTMQPEVPADVEEVFPVEDMPEVAGVGTDGTLEPVDDEDIFTGIPTGSTEPMPEDPTVDPAPPVEDPNTGSSDPVEPNTTEPSTDPVETEPSPPEPSEPEPVQENPVMAHLRDIRDAVDKEMEEVRSEEGDN